MSCKETAEGSRHISPRVGKTQGDVDSASVGDSQSEEAGFVLLSLEGKTKAKERKSERVAFLLREISV